MSSYISGFKALFAALAIIGLVEAGYAAVYAPSPVEASSYLNWNFNSVELPHKVLIHEKLANALRDRADVIQIGDSSGHHGIVPAVVDQYLSGLRYANLSCCANTGFDGYASIAEFMLHHVPTIRAVVLYISLNNPPHDPASLSSDVIGGEDRLRSAFGPLAPLTSPGMLSLRHAIVRPLYELDGLFGQSGLMPFGELWPELIQSLRATRGWRPEQDVHRLPAGQLQKFQELCGPDFVRRVDGYRPEDYTRDIFGLRHSYTEIELRRLADVARHHGARLILLLQPYPCRALAGSYVEALRSDIAAVAADYPNLIVPDPALFEAWPAQWFSSADHLRAGYEDLTSRRAGRLIAKALGIAYVEPPIPPPRKPSRPVLSTGASGFASWKVEGLTMKVAPEGEGAVLVETADAREHHLGLTLLSPPPGTYVATIRFKTAAPREVFFRFLSLQWPGDSGHFHCSAASGEVSRTMSVLDAAIEALPDGSMKCSGKFKITRAGSLIDVGLSPNLAVAPYQGDGRSSVVLYDFELSAVDDSI